MFAPPAYVLLCQPSGQSELARGGSVALIEAFALLLAIGLPIAYLGMALFGLPLALWLRGRDQLASWRLLLAGLPGGAMVLLLSFWQLGFGLAWSAQLLIGAFGGLVVASAFCLICGIPWRARSVGHLDTP